MLIGMASLPSPGSGGSEGTTDRVFRQFGHMKQFRAHLDAMSETERDTKGYRRPVLLGAYTGTRNLKETVWTVIAADFDRHAAVASNGIAFLAKKQHMERVETVG